MENVIFFFFLCIEGFFFQSFITDRCFLYCLQIEFAPLMEFYLNTACPRQINHFFTLQPKGKQEKKRCFTLKLFDAISLASLLFDFYWISVLFLLNVIK